MLARTIADMSQNITFEETGVLATSKIAAPRQSGVAKLICCSLKAWSYAIAAGRQLTQLSARWADTSKKDMRRRDNQNGA
jgi:hypothetical protein